MASEPYDILIIGGGPAGLSAVASIVRQDHTVVLFDSGAYRNAGARHPHTVPAWDDRDPAEFRAAAPARPGALRHRHGRARRGRGCSAGWG